jgi:glutamine synthetase
MVNTLLEYVWIDGKNNVRSKTRVIKMKTTNIQDVPVWNYDGSSTYQASGHDSEITLKPCALFNYDFSECANIDLANPSNSIHHKLVLCDTYLPNGKPTEHNHRYNAVQIFNQALEEIPWFGLEQEYFMFDSKTKLPLGFPLNDNAEQGKYYCSAGTENAFGRKLAEEHLRVCLMAGINICGINAEVAPGQWEFQIGPCVGIEQGDHLWMARYLLHKLSEKYNIVIDFHPKPLIKRWTTEPFFKKWNGSGCHANFSTKHMRDGGNNLSGLDHINEAIIKLSHTHVEHMEVYGEDNRLRMTGECETASYDVFTEGIANRSASIRRGNDTIKNQRGYFEDRRPAANCDPYLVTSKIFATCMDL